jgi:hypothetical protein
MILFDILGMVFIFETIVYRNYFNVNYLQLFYYKMYKTKIVYYWYKFIKILKIL